MAGNLESTGKRKSSPLRYAVGMFGTSIPINMFKTFAVFFYADQLNLITTKSFSLILFIYTFVDAIDNPIYGFLSDRSHTRWGRRRPWLMIGAPLLTLAFIFFFNPPALLAPGSAFSYVLLMYILTGTLDSLINANYGALFPELFRTETERAKTNAMRQVFQLTAMVVSIALTPVITGKIGYSKTALIYGVLAVAVIWYMTLGAHENLENMDKPKPSLWNSLRAIATNPKFWIYGVANAAFSAAISLVQAGVPFYVKYYLKAGDTAATILLGVAILSAIAFIPAWVRIIKKTTLMPAWRLAFLIICVGILPLAFTSNLIAAAVVIVLLGFGMGGVQTTMDIVAARILDEDAEKNGFQREGIYSSLLGVLNKSSGLFVSLAYLLVANIYGFESGANPGSAPDSAARFLTVYFPAALLVIAVIVSQFLKFKQPDQKETDGLPAGQAQETDAPGEPGDQGEI